MPIKVRCKECGQGMAVPDKAAGRAVKCKGCGARVAVPGAKVEGGEPAKKAPAKKKKAKSTEGGSAGALPPRKKKKKRRPPAAAAPSFDAFDNPDDMFSGLNLGGAEDEEVKLCPSCAQPVDEEDIDCPNCGVNVESGAMSVEQKARRARKGPPPEEYYGVVWKNGWAFLMNHKGYALKTGLLWGFSATMVIIAAFILNWYTRTRAIELVDTAEGDVTITATGVIIQPLKEGGTGSATYDGVKYGTGSTRLVNGKAILPPPHIAAMFAPPTFFWAFIFLVFTLAFGGWAWVLSAKIIEVTLAKQKTIKRFQGDMFGNMTKGFTTLAWPVVLMYPVIWIPGAMFFAGVSQTVCIITFICLFLLPYFVFLPNAMVHMAQPYSYRAWLISWMGKDFLNTLVPAVFTSGIFVLLVLLPPLAIAIGIAVGWDQFIGFYMNTIELNALGPMGYVIADADSSGSVSFLRLPLMFMVSFLCCTTLFTILAFPASMLMRIFGLFALYFREDMEVCVEQVPMSPAGFGPRFLAIQVDAIISAMLVAVAIFAAGFIAGLFQHLYDSPSAGRIIYWVCITAGVLGSLSFYFANWESGSGRATLGKWSFGMLVLQDDNSPMTFQHAVKRFFASLLTPLSAGITFLMCAFHPTHRAVHDTLTKTKVVWRGDEEM